MKVPFFRLRFGPAEKKSVLGVLKSGWVTSGPAVRDFEEKIKLLSGAKYAAAVSSCSAGLHLALKALSIGQGDEVITTPLTMAATIEAILHCGGRPVLADIDPKTLNIDPQAVKSKIDRKTRAIISVDMAGRPCEYNQLKKLAREKNLYLIEDAAHALGAVYHNRPIGSIADATVFSFYSTKNITSGEGGMVVSNSKKIIDKVRQLSLHGMTSSGWKRYSGGSWKYDISELGFKYNLSDLAAGLALGQLNHFRDMQKKRNRLASCYMEHLKELEEYIELPHDDPKSTHARHLFIIKLNLTGLKITRDRFIDELEKNGIGCGVHFIPVYHFSYFRKTLKFKKSDYPDCESSFKKIISLPFYPDLTYEEVDFVCDIIRKLIKEYRK